MTISSETRKAGPYTGNDVTSSFAFTFKVFTSADIRVVETLISTGVETDLVLNTNYTVTLNGDQNANPGGSITYKVGGVTTALPSTKKLTILGDLAYTQSTDITNGGGFYPQVVEDRFDYLTILVQQVKEEVNRSVKVDVSSSTDPDDLIDDLEADAAAATAAASAAAASASSAATSAATATAAVGAIMWNDIVFITVADSPYSITNSHRGKLIAVDATGGAVTITLPEISTLTISPGFVVGVKKTDGTGNNVTINRSGTDTIDGATSKTIGSMGAGATLIPDTDPAPDEWTSTDFGVSANNLTVDRFSGDGVDTTFTLSVDPGSENNTTVYISGVYQQKDTYSVSGTTLTFSAAPPVGTGNIEVVTGSMLPIGTPSDASVTTVKLADNSVTVVKLASSALGFAMVNGTLTASVGSSALTVAIKTLAGTDPSATDPVYVLFRSATAGSGTFSVITLTAATSVVVSSGSTLGTTSAVASRTWIVGFNDGGTFRLGVVNCSTSSVIYPLADDILASSTAEGGAGAADSAGVIYTGTAVTAKAMRVLGYLESTQATAGTWATTPSKVQLQTPGMQLPGDTVQIAVSQTGAMTTGTTLFPLDDTIPQITEGDQVMSLSVTPLSEINHLAVEHAGAYSSNANTNYVVALFRDATANALAASIEQPGATANSPAVMGVNFSVLAGATTSTTFRIRAGATDAGTLTFNGINGGRLFGGVMNSYLRVCELMG